MNVNNNLIGVIPRLKAIEELGICEATEFKLREDGILIPLRLGRKVFYRISDIQNAFRE